MWILIIYFLQPHKLNFLKHSYFYKLVCMFSEDSNQPAHPHSLTSFYTYSIRYTASSSR